MINKDTTPRLLAAAKEFNIGKATVIEFLWNNGFEINCEGNEKLSEKMYNALKDNFERYKKVNLLIEVESPRIIENQIKLEKQKINLEKQRNKKLKDKEQPDLTLSPILSRKRKKIILPPPQPKLLQSLFSEDEIVNFTK